MRVNKLLLRGFRNYGEAEAEFDPGYYIDYLEKKYTELYGL